MFHRKSRACSSRNTDAEFGHCEYKVAPRAMHWEAAHSTPEKKKTLQKHEKNTYSRTKGSNAQCIYCTASWKVGCDGVRATERKMATLSGRDNTLTLNELKISNLSSKSWKVTLLGELSRRKHIDFTFNSKCQRLGSGHISRRNEAVAK